MDKKTDGYGQWPTENNPEEKLQGDGTELHVDVWIYGHSDL